MASLAGAILSAEVLHEEVSEHLPGNLDYIA